MFEKLSAHADRRAREKADERTRKIAARLAAQASPGVQTEAGPDGVRIAGRGLARRFALDPALRWLTMGALR
ncbi:MAG: hypothetical protein KF780_11700 [Sphingomonas sp.]|nr:hypothetical protein [Sphingomonas sp.]